MNEDFQKIKEQVIDYYISAVIPCFKERKKNEFKRKAIGRFDKDNIKTNIEILQLAFDGCGEALLLCYSMRGIYSSLPQWQELVDKYPEEKYSFFCINASGCSIMKLIEMPIFTDLPKEEKKRKKEQYNKLVADLTEKRIKEITKIFDDSEKNNIENFFLNIATYDIIEEAYELVHNNKNFNEDEIEFFNIIYNRYKEKSPQYYLNSVKNDMKLKNKSNPKPIIKTKFDAKTLKKWEEDSTENIEKRFLCFNEEDLSDFSNALLKTVNKDLFKQKAIYINMFYKNENCNEFVNKFVKHLISAKNSNDRDRFLQFPLDFILHYIKDNKNDKNIISIIENQFENLIITNNLNEISKVLRLMEEIDKVSIYMQDIEFITKIESKKFVLLISKLYKVYEKDFFYSLLFKCLLILKEHGKLLEYIEPLAIFAWDEKQILKIYEWLMINNPDSALSYFEFIEKRCYGINNELKKIKDDENLKEQEIFTQFAEQIVGPLSNIESELVTVDINKETSKQLQEHMMTIVKKFRDSLSVLGFDSVVDKSLWNNTVEFNPDKHSNDAFIKFNTGDKVKVVSLGIKLTKHGNKKWNAKVKKEGSISNEGNI